MAHKCYFPLYPSKGKIYRKPHNVACLYINADIDSQFISAAYTGGDAPVTFESPVEVAEFITSLPDKTWIITYDIDNWASIFNALINTFDRITGVGKYNNVIELERAGAGWSVVNAFSFLACPFYEAVYKLLGDDLQEGEPTANIVNLLWRVWDEIVKIFKTQFNCYPSKTPGATAIKIWRRFLPCDIHATGQHTNRITRAAIHPPALHWRPGVYDMAYMYDISASYPFVMANMRFPLTLWTFINTPPKFSRWIATVKINYKCYGEFSPICFRLLDGSNVNPIEVKGARITLTYIDAVTLEATGEFEILEWVEGVTWGPEDEADLFGPWAAAIEQASQEQKTKQVLKIVSRALHSKFAQRPYYTFVEFTRVDIDELERMIRQPGRVLDTYELDNGELAAKIATRKRAAFKPFERPDYEALIMAMARFRVYASIDVNTIYTHTDCIISTEPRDDLPIGQAFGCWKYKDNGPAFVAGLGLYAIGAEVGKTGMKVSTKQARYAIERAAGGEAQILQALYHPDLFSPIQAGNTRFTVQAQNYPRATIRGLRAWVTRSPTRIILVKPIPRLMSCAGYERVLKL